MPPTLAEVVEDEQDHSLLSGLELDQQAALLELRGSQQAMDGSGDWENTAAPTNTIQSRDSTTSVAAVPNSHTTLDAGLVRDLRTEIESLRSSTQDSFHSACEGVSDRVWQQSQRLSLLLAKDQGIISQRWSQSISASRKSYVSFRQQTEMSQLLSDQNSSSTSPPLQENDDSPRNLDGLNGAVSPGQLAESYCFSCFDLAGFEENAKLVDILPVLSRRYNLGLGNNWPLYVARLVVAQRGVETGEEIHMFASPLPRFRTWAALKKACILVLYRRIENLNMNETKLAATNFQPLRQAVEGWRLEKDKPLELREEGPINVPNRDKVTPDIDHKAAVTRLNRILLAPVTATIPRYCYADDKFWFLIEAQFEDGGSWMLQRFYQDFYDLQIGLLQEYPLEAGNVKGRARTLPYMPGPFPYVSENITNERRPQLEEYLQVLLKMGQHISKSYLVRKFFTPREGDFELKADSTRFVQMLSGSQDGSSGKQTVNAIEQPNTSSTDEEGSDESSEISKSFSR